jgi:hypothetical protein
MSLAKIRESKQTAKWGRNTNFSGIHFNSHHPAATGGIC